MRTEEQDRLRRAFASTLPTDRPREDCPPAEKIWQGVQDELSPADLRDLIRHISVCPICTEAWLMAKKLEERPGGKVPARRTGRSFESGLRIASVAAAAALLFTLGSLVLDRAHYERFLTAPDESGSASALRASGAAELELLVQSPLKRDRCILRWRGPVGARYYDIRVTSAAQPAVALADVSRLEIPEYQVAKAALAALPGNAKLQVHIEAYHPIDGKLASDNFFFHVE